MQDLKNHKKSIAAVFLIAFVLFLGASLYIQTMQSNYALLTKLKIAEQESTLTALAEMISREGADSVVEGLIQDCSAENRAQFDTDLGRLHLLRGAELIEMEKLFNDCGNFYAQRKAVMVARFEREYQMFLDLIEILSLVEEKKEILPYKTEKWGELVKLEVERSSLSTELVHIQGNIIRALRLNVTIASDEMQAMLVDGQKNKDMLIELAPKIDSIRSEIIGL